MILSTSNAAGAATGQTLGHHLPFVSARAATVVLLVDVSGSMQSDDLPPTRLGATVAAIRLFLKRVPDGVRVGLVTFSARVHVLQTPTTNRLAILQELMNLQIEAGTAPGSGLKTALKVTLNSLDQQSIKTDASNASAIILMASDGGTRNAGPPPLQFARRAKSDGIHIDSIVVGTARGGITFTYAGKKGRIPTPVDAKLLEQISNAAQGQAFLASTAVLLRAAYSQVATALRR